VPRIRGEVVLLAFIALIAGAALLDEARSHPDILLEHFTLADAFRTPVTHISNTRSAKKGTVILVHGSQCNKSMMVQLGKALAQQGLDAYAIDLPGHGASRATFTLEKSHEAVRSAVSRLITMSGMEDSRVILIGHSFGATVIGPIALDRPNIAASIYLGPGEVKALQRDAPRNVMILTAQHDYEHIKRYAREAYHDLTQEIDSKRFNHVHGDLALGVGRTWAEMPDTNHLSLIYNGEVYRLVEQWIEGALDIQLTPAPFSAKMALLSLLFPLAISVVAASLLSKLLWRRGVEPMPRFGRALQPFLVYCYALIVGTILSAFVARIKFLRLLEGEILVAFLTSIGIVGIVVSIAIAEKRSAYGGMNMLKGAVLAASTFLVLYLCVDFFIASEIYYASFPVAHYGRMFAFFSSFICLLPFFLFNEEARCYFIDASKTGWWGVCISAITCVTFNAGCLGILMFLGVGLGRFAGAVFIMTVYCLIVASIFYRITRSVIPGTVFNTLVAAWLISVGFAYY
jgi:Esterase/lipase